MSPGHKCSALCSHPGLRLEIPPTLEAPHWQHPCLLCWLHFLPDPRGIAGSLPRVGNLEELWLQCLPMACSRPTAAPAWGHPWTFQQDSAVGPHWVLLLQSHQSEGLDDPGTGSGPWCLPTSVPSPWSVSREMAERQQGRGDRKQDQRVRSLPFCS